MVKAAALYIVIIISLLIAMISASLLTIAFYYKLENQKKIRFDKLSANLESGMAILLSANFKAAEEDRVLDLFGDQKDSVSLSKIKWGVFELHAVRAFELKDTLKRSFFSGTTFTDQSAIYLADEDRPLSVSGSTKITGDGELPKAGLKQSYVDGRPYEGKEVIYGSIKDSGREVPLLTDEVLTEIEDYLMPMEVFGVLPNDSIENSFFNKTAVYQLAPGQMNIDHHIRGKVIVVSDTVINISAEASLEDVQVYAPAIIVAEGFKGSCQLFARDSIVIGKNCSFEYPSFAGVFKPDDEKIQSKVSLAEGCRFSGILLSYEAKRSDLQTMVALSKDCVINGEVYSAGYIKLEKSVNVKGKVYARRFMMQVSGTLYENYLIDMTLNRKELSKYYLSSGIFKRDQQQYKVLKWLN